LIEKLKKYELSISSLEVSLNKYRSYESESYSLRSALEAKDKELSDLKGRFNDLISQIEYYKSFEQKLKESESKNSSYFSELERWRKAFETKSSEIDEYKMKLT
jgi:chromosome segregation ATPase